MPLTLTMLTTWIGLTVANFGYAVLMNQDIARAAEHSFFQAIALGTAWATLRAWQRAA